MIQFGKGFLYTTAQRYLFIAHLFIFRKMYFNYKIIDKIKLQ